jgi:hypothetical protein
MTDRAYVERNAAARAHMRRLVDGLTDDEAAQVLVGTWSVGTILAHVAFWDRLVAARWAAALRAGQATPTDLPDGLTDLINDAAASEWAVLPAKQIGALALGAAEAVDALVAGLPDASVDAVVGEGRSRLVERWRHREGHLVELDAIRPG